MESCGVGTLKCYSIGLAVVRPVRRPRPDHPRAVTGPAPRIRLGRGGGTAAWGGNLRSPHGLQCSETWGNQPGAIGGRLPGCSQGGNLAISMQHSPEVRALSAGHPTRGDDGDQKLRPCQACRDKKSGTNYGGQANRVRSLIQHHCQKHH